MNFARNTSEHSEVVRAHPAARAVATSDIFYDVRVPAGEPKPRSARARAPASLQVKTLNARTEINVIYILGRSDYAR